MPAVDPEDLLELAVDAAERAGELLLDRFGAPATGVATKSTPTDLVSDADRDAEGVVVETIRRARPVDGFLLEEAGASPGGELTWVIDPLDGTVNYLFGIPHWCVSVGVEDGDGTVAGVIYDPNKEEVFTGLRGGGAYLNGDPISVADRTDLAQALVATGFYYDAAVRALQAEILTRLLPRVRDLRRAGSAALDLAALACGRIDGFYEAPLEPWDKVAGMLIVAEAGGVFTDLPEPHGFTPGVVGSNHALHEQLRAVVLG